MPELYCDEPQADREMLKRGAVESRATRNGKHYFASNYRLVGTYDEEKGVLKYTALTDREKKRMMRPQPLSEQDSLFGFEL